MKTFLNIYRDPSIGGSVASGAASGAALGSFIPGWGTAVGALAGAAYGLITGIGQKKKANQLLANNRFPNQPIPQGYLENQAYARQQANVGLPSEVYQNSVKQIERNKVQGLSAAQDRRGAMAAISTLQQNANDAYDKLNASDALARLQNKRLLFAANTQVGGAQQAAFDWNGKARYMQNYNYGMTLQGAGNQNISNAVDLGVSAFMPYGRQYGAYREPTDTVARYARINSTTGPLTTWGGAVSAPAPSYQ